MAKSPIAADKVFEHAECFYQAFAALCRLSPDPREDLHAAITLAEPLIVLAALANELFLKCIICIETGKTARASQAHAGQQYPKGGLLSEDHDEAGNVSDHARRVGRLTRGWVR